MRHNEHFSVCESSWRCVPNGKLEFKVSAEPTFKTTEDVAEQRRAGIHVCAQPVIAVEEDVAQLKIRAAGKQLIEL